MNVGRGSGAYNPPQGPGRGENRNRTQTLTPGTPGVWRDTMASPSAPPPLYPHPHGVAGSSAQPVQDELTAQERDALNSPIAPFLINRVNRKDVTWITFNEIAERFRLTPEHARSIVNTLSDLSERGVDDARFPRKHCVIPHINDSQIIVTLRSPDYHTKAWYPNS